MRDAADPIWAGPRAGVPTAAVPGWRDALRALPDTCLSGFEDEPRHPHMISVRASLYMLMSVPAGCPSGADGRPSPDWKSTGQGGTRWAAGGRRWGDKSQSLRETGRAKIEILRNGIKVSAESRAVWTFKILRTRGVPHSPPHLPGHVPSPEGNF
jgi:hypothetical protein